MILRTDQIQFLINFAAKYPKIAAEIFRKTESSTTHVKVTFYKYSKELECHLRITENEYSNDLSFKSYELIKEGNIIHIHLLFA